MTWLIVVIAAGIFGYVMVSAKDWFDDMNGE